MEHECAMQHALGYAAGREDNSIGNVKTVDPSDSGIGFTKFAEAYANGWDEYNNEKRGSMVNCRDAYDNWQASNGLSIFKTCQFTLLVTVDDRMGWSRSLVAYVAEIPGVLECDTI
jgi:hypothetical protein